MARTFSLSVRYLSRETLADAYAAGVLTLPLRLSPPAGTRALVDVAVGTGSYLVWGEVLDSAGPGAAPKIRLTTEGRARIEEALEPPVAAPVVEEPIRVYDRHSVDVPALVSGKLVARVRDLSSSGARLSFARTAAPRAGTLIHLTLFPKGAAAIPAPVIAKVVWRSADGCSVGVSFVPGAARSVQLLLDHAAVASDRPIAA